jgi:hypothetical protein
MENIVDLLDINETEKFPVPKHLWEFFAAKKTNTVFLSIGSGSSPMVELHISENLGCKIHIFDDSQDAKKNWTAVGEMLTSRKSNETTPEFAKSASKKWVLPRNLFYYGYIPHFQSSEEGIQKTVKSICSELNEERIDILKLDCIDRTCGTLYSILSSGYRPGVVMICWEPTPDSSLQNTLLAGHLQTCGYGLVAKYKNNFLYYFTDRGLYDTVSWETNVVENPLVNGILDSVHGKNMGNH